MTAVIGFSLCVLLVMLVVPDSPVGRLLHRQLVERPLAQLGRLERHHLIFATIIGAAMLAGGEVVAVLGPELAVMWALDLAIYLDAVMVTYALSALAGVRGVRSKAARIVSRLLAARPRARRRRGAACRSKPASNDDDPHPAWKAAA